MCVQSPYRVSPAHQIQGPHRTFHTSRAGGYPYNASIRHPGRHAENVPVTATEKNSKRRATREPNDGRQVECKRNKLKERNTTRRVLESVENVVRNDEKRYNTINAPYTPRNDLLDSLARPTRPVECNANATPRLSTKDTIPRKVQRDLPTPPFFPTPPPSFPTPDVRCPSPLPHLTPFLNPVLDGEQPITFNISHHPTLITHNPPTSLSHPFDASDFDMPATEPRMREMTIDVVVDDGLPEFEWTIRVENPMGVRCGDVFWAIWMGFWEGVGRGEYEKWGKERREGARRAYYRRIAEEGGAGGREGMRRIDYMSGGLKEGGGVMFRGMTSAFDESGRWLMFVGPPEV